MPYLVHSNLQLTLPLAFSEPSDHQLEFELKINFTYLQIGIIKL